jgi:hypothetical protein
MSRQKERIIGLTSLKNTNYYVTDNSMLPKKKKKFCACYFSLLCQRCNNNRYLVEDIVCVILNTSRVIFHQETTTALNFLLKSAGPFLPL